MLSIEKHIDMSLKRTGKGFRELNEWMDWRGVSYRGRIARHDSRRIPEFSPRIIKRLKGLKEPNID